MKTSYAIVLFIFVFSLMSTTINELGIFDWNTVETGLDSDSITEIEDMAHASTNVKSGSSEGDVFGLFAGVQMIINAAGVMLKAFGSTVVVYFTLVNIGFPVAIASMLQGLVSLVEAIAITEFISGRRAVK